MRGDRPVGGFAGLSLSDDISCLSLRLRSDIPRGSDISFQWALSRLASAGTSRIQFETPLSFFQLPVNDNSLPGLSLSGIETTPWTAESVRGESIVLSRSSDGAILNPVVFGARAGKRRPYRPAGGG